MGNAVCAGPLCRRIEHAGNGWTVGWRFSADAADRARRFVFDPGQIMVENDDGTITVAFDACGLLEMAWRLYSWGDKVEVLEPAE